MSGGGSSAMTAGTTGGAVDSEESLLFLTFPSTAVLLSLISFPSIGSSACPILSSFGRGAWVHECTSCAHLGAIHAIFFFILCLSFDI